jgi:hypothetical protein
MDERFIEQAQELQDMLVANAIASAAQAVEKRLPWIGCCHYCAAKLPQGVNFCDADCCADYEAVEAAKKRAGR